MIRRALARSINPLARLGRRPTNLGLQTISTVPSLAARASQRLDTAGARPLAVEGLFQSVAQGLGETYLSALMVWLGAGGVILGLTGAVPTAATAFSQIAAARLAEGVRGARAFIARTWVLQGMALVAIGCVASLPPALAVPSILAIAVLTWALAGLSVPAWTSLVAGTVPRPNHGRFFGLRGAIQQAGVVISILCGGAMLSVTASIDKTWLGFLVVFTIAGIVRIVGTGLLFAVAEKGRAREGIPVRALWTALESSAKFRRLAVYLWSLHFATWVAAPFFLPFMLRELRIDYATAGALIALPAVVKVLTMPRWGRLADRVGPGPLLRATGWFVLPVSAMWLVSDRLWWIAIAQVYAGLAWGAFELAQASALLQTTRGREEAVALFNAVDGAVMILGAAVGGLIVMGAEELFGFGFLAAIAASTALRALVAVVFLRSVRRIGVPRFQHRTMPILLWGVRATRGATFRPWGGILPAETGGPHAVPAREV